VAQEILKEQETTETMSIEIENKLDRIIQLLEELLQEVKKPSLPTQGEDTEWHNPENVSIEQLGHGYRFLKPWGVDGRHRGIAQLWAFTKWAGACGVSAGSHSDTYRVPINAPIPPKP